MSGPLLCRNDTQCRPRFGDIWRCRRHVGDTSATCGAKLILDYNEWGHLAPLSWTKMLWRSLKYHSVDIYMKYETIPLPRENDKLVMEIIKERISSKAALQSLNRCRCYLNVLFLSDVATADGKYLEELATIPNEIGTKSKYRFPKEVPTKTDWKRWQLVLGRDYGWDLRYCYTVDVAINLK